MQILIFSLVMILASLGCTPSGGVRPRESTKSGASNLTGGSSATGSLGTAETGVESKQATGVLGTPSSTTGSIVVLTPEMLSKMSLAQVQSYYTSNIAELDKQKEKFSISDQIATALCLRLQQLNSQCIVANALVPDGGSSLICVPGSTGTLESTESPYKVTLTDTNQNPLNASNFSGQFILVANGLYESTPFGAGQKSSISFSFKGSGNQPSPLIMQITSLEIRTAPDTVSGTYASTILNKQAPPMPSTPFYVHLFYNDTELTDGPVSPPTNSSYTNYRYLVSTKPINKGSASSYCRVTQAEINDIKSKIANSVTSQNAEMAAAKGNKTPLSLLSATKDQLGAAILDAQSKMATLAPLLQNNENRILNFTGELQAYQAVGCHASEPITQMTIEVFGKKNDPKLLTDNWDKCPLVNPQGSSSTLEFTMGSSIKIDIDTDKFGVVGGSPWTGPVSDQALVSSLRYLKIAKLGVGIVDAGEICKPGFGGLSKSCAMTCEETGTFSITGVKIKVETPGTQGAVTIYDNESVNVTLGSSFYSPTAVISWLAPDLRSDAKWLEFMSRTDCDATK